MERSSFDNSRVHRINPVPSLIVLALLQFGCAQVMVPGTLTGAGEFYRYTSGGVAEETVIGNLDEIVSAAKSALGKMDIDLKGIERSEQETVLYAETAGLNIEIELQPVTSRAVKISVDSTKNHLIKDKATSGEILSQIRLSMGMMTSSMKRTSRIYIQNDCRFSIMVAVYSLQETDGKEIWQTHGWFDLDPGERQHAAETGNRYIYFYAESRRDREYIWAGNRLQRFKGKTYAFFEADSGNRWIEFTQSFKCGK